MLYSTIRAVVGGTLVSGPMVIVSPVITLVPASVQLLVENATKHNAVSSSRPLKIVISSDGRSLTVRNNLNPKFTIVQSTGIGQKYIRQQYLDACGKNIKIEKTDNEYAVVLPLIEQNLIPVGDVAKTD